MGKKRLSIDAATPYGPLYTVCVIVFAPSFIVTFFASKSKSLKFFVMLQSAPGDVICMMMGLSATRRRMTNIVPQSHAGWMSISFVPIFML